MRDDTISRLVAIMASLRLSNTTAGAFAGVAASTIRECLSRGELPVRGHARTAIERFVALNANAKCRADVRLVP